MFEFGDTYDNTGGASGMGRVELGVRPFDHLTIRVSGGGFLWGYPAETVGYGGFLMLGLGWEF